MRLKITIGLIKCLFFINAIAQDSGFTISGNIKNLPDGSVFYLILNKDGGGADTVDRIKSKNGRFKFIGRLKKEGQLAFIKIDTSIVKLGKSKDQLKQKQSWVRLLLDNSMADIKLKGDVSNWPEIEIIGSPLTKQYDEFISNINPALIEVNRKIKEAKRDESKIAEAKKEYEKRYLKTLEGMPDSYAIPLFLFNNRDIDPDVKQKIYQRLSSDRVRNSYYGKKLEQQIVNTRASKNIGIGRIIPEFKIKNFDGKLDSIREIARKSKYTLIDFWAYWCKPCRADIPNLKKVYNAFNDRGFNILSVSTDLNDMLWRKALKEENMPWLNGMQEGNISKDVFGLIAIPAYILLNEKAEIVMMDMTSSYFSNSVGTMNGAQVFVKKNKKNGLRGDDLYQVIESLLKEEKSK